MSTNLGAVQTLTMPQGILFVFYMTRTAPCSRSESR